MRVLITGSAGQLGREIGKLLAPHHEVVGLDIKNGGTTTIIGDVSDRNLIFKLVKDVDTVIHTASLHAPHVEQFSKERFVDVNIKGTLNLLEAAVKYKIKKFVYTGTTSVYGEAMIPRGGRAVWVTEDLVPNPRDIYDITKLTAEQLCRQSAREFKLPTVCLRVSRFWNEAEELKTIYRLYRGVDVRDAAAAHLLALNDTNILFDIFNISARTPFGEHETPELFADAARAITKHYPAAPKFFERRGWKLPSSIDRVYVTTKAETDLNYVPKYNFADILKTKVSAGNR